MYNHFFGLQENPFNINPDPKYLFLTPQTQAALDQLNYGIQTHQGLILLTGEVGTGKTTVINRLLASLQQQQTPTAFIFNSHLGTGDLLDYMLADFRVPQAAQSEDNKLARLNHWLLGRQRAGQFPVLIVDEAQGLSTAVLEEIRMLLNWEAPEEKPLQIVLAGQPELEAMLNRPELRQLKQRIAFRCKTAALTLAQTQEYIQSRLNTAGARGRQLFASEAVQAVDFYSQGIPRVINLLCEHALMGAYVDDVRLVHVGLVEQAAHDLQFDDRPLPSFMTFSVAERGGAGRSARPDASRMPSTEVTLQLTDAHEEERRDERKQAVAVAVVSPSQDGGPNERRELHSVAVATEGDAMPVPIHAWTILDGSTVAISVSQSVSQKNVTSPQQFPASSSATRSPATQPPLIPAAWTSRAHEWWQASTEVWARVFDERALQRFADAQSRAAHNVRRLSRVLPSAVAARTLQGGKSLLRWLREPIRSSQFR